MRLLIDTHVWLWALSANQRLGRGARDLIQDRAPRTIAAYARGLAEYLEV